MTARHKKKSALLVAEKLTGLPSDKFYLKTTTIDEGLTNLGCFLHEIYVDGAPLAGKSFIEKHTKLAREYEVAPGLQALLLPGGKMLGPEIYRFVKGTGYKAIFMEFVQGANVEEQFLLGDPPEGAVQEMIKTLSTVASYKGELDDTRFTQAALGPLEEVAADPDAPQAIREISQKLRDVMFVKLEQVIAALPRVTCHNDVYFANMFWCDDAMGGKCMRLIDWGTCGRNMAGAELHHFVSAALHEDALVPTAQALLDGYTGALQQQGLGISREQVHLGALSYGWLRAVQRFRRLKDFSNPQTAKRFNRLRMMAEMIQGSTAKL